MSPVSVSPKFSSLQTPLTVPCPIHTAAKDLVMSLIHSLWAFCWAQISTNEHMVWRAHEDHSHCLTSCCQREISSELPLLLPLSCSIQSSVRPSHLRDRCSTIPLWHTLYFLKMCQWKIQTNLLSLSLSKKNNPQRMCALSSLIHWAVTTYRSENLVKDRRCVLLQVREELPKI